MKHKILFLLSFVLILAVSGCRKESDIIEFENLKFYNSDIFGIVVDENGTPVFDAKVTFGTKVVLTDKRGVYTFKNVEVNANHSVVHISKDGYFEGIKVFSTGKEAKLQLRTILLEKKFDKEFNGGTGGTISKEAITLEFSANSIVIESSNTLYTGPVSVAIKYLNPDDQNIWLQMPGNMSAINSDNRLSVLNTYGMVAVELRGSGGEKLNIGSGYKVKMSAEIPASLRSGAPSTIPLWYFDETTGYWKEEGSASISGNKYVGEVSHFSFWNYDTQNPSVNLSGRVIDVQGVPLSGLEVRVYAVNEFYGPHGRTNPDGTFSGAVAQNQLLTIEISSIGQGGCPNQLLYSANIGPYANDFDLRDIIVTIPYINTYAVHANILDCAGNPLQNGYMAINLGQYNTEYLQILNGIVTTNIISCASNLSFTYYAVDEDQQVQSPQATGILSDNTDLGTISACGVFADNFKVIIPSLGITHIYDSKSTHLYIDGFGFLAASDSVFNSIQIRWNDSGVDNFSVGTYNIYYGGMDIIPNPDPLGSTAYIVESGTVTVTAGGGSSSIIEGTYFVDMKEISTGKIIPVNGSFKKKF